MTRVEKDAMAEDRGERRDNIGDTRWARTENRRGGEDIKNTCGRKAEGKNG